MTKSERGEKGKGGAKFLDEKNLSNLEFLQNE